MGYEAALKKAWDDLTMLSKDGRQAVTFLNKAYTIDIKNRKLSASAGGLPSKPHLSIILLHYLIGLLKARYEPSGEWVSFKDIEGGEIYYPAFREGAIKPLLAKYGDDPEKIVTALERFDTSTAPNRGLKAADTRAGSVSTLKHTRSLVRRAHHIPSPCRGIGRGSRRVDFRKIKAGDTGIELTAFKDVNIRLIFWKGDEEFGPEANILFDKNLIDLFSTEDIAVFLRLVACSI